MLSQEFSFSNRGNNMSDESRKLSKEEIERIESADSLYWKGRSAKNRGELDTARQLFLRSRELNPKSATALRLYETLIALGEPSEAGFFAEEAYALNPKNDLSCMYYAETLIAGNNLEKAKTVLREALKRNSTYKPAERRLAEIDNL
jgi:tetratricopeptide (TPR) repeat protein